MPHRPHWISIRLNIWSWLERTARTVTQQETANNSRHSSPLDSLSSSPLLWPAVALRIQSYHASIRMFLSGCIGTHTHTHTHTHKLFSICNRVVLVELQYQQAVPHFQFYPCCLKIRTQTTWTRVCVCVCDPQPLITHVVCKQQRL